MLRRPHRRHRCPRQVLASSSGPTLSLGTAPAPAVGGSVAARLGYGLVGLRLALRGELPASTAIVPTGIVSTRTVLACAGAGLGSIASSTEGIARPATDSGRLIVLVATAGADVALGRILYLEPFPRGDGQPRATAGRSQRIPRIFPAARLGDGRPPPRRTLSLMGGGPSRQAAGVETAPADSQRRAERSFFRSMFDANAGYVAASLVRLGIAPGDRDDLVSEIFVRVHKELATYDADRPIRPWLFAFAARVASEHRRLARHRREVLGEVADVLALLRAERPIADLGPPAKAAILASVEARIGAPPLPGGGGDAGPGGGRVRVARAQPWAGLGSRAQWPRWWRRSRWAWPRGSSSPRT